MDKLKTSLYLHMLVCTWSVRGVYRSKYQAIRNMLDCLLFDGFAHIQEVVRVCHSLHRETSEDS